MRLSIEIQDWGNDTPNAIGRIYVYTYMSYSNLYMCIHVYTFIFVYIYICMYVYEYICIIIYLIYKHTYIYLYIYTIMCICIYKGACVWLCIVTSTNHVFILLKRRVFEGVLARIYNGFWWCQNRNYKKYTHWSVESSKQKWWLAMTIPYDDDTLRWRCVCRILRYRKRARTNTRQRLSRQEKIKQTRQSERE